MVADGCAFLRRLCRASILVFFLALSLSACSKDNNSSVVTRGAGVAAPPSAQQRIAPIPTAMDTFRALAPPEGMRFTPLFNEKIGNTDARMKRLEDAVQTIRNDVDTLVPTMVRMVAIEKDIKGLVAQLQTLTDQSPAPASAAPAQEPQKKKKKAALNTIPGEDVAKGTEARGALPTPPAPAASSSVLVTPEAASKGELPPEGAASPNSKASDFRGLILPSEASHKIPGEDVAKGTEAKGVLPTPKVPAASSSVLVTPEAALEGELPPAGAASPNSVVNMRIADYADKTRLVIDMTGSAATPAHITEDGKTLVIDLSALHWGGETVWQADKTKRIIGGRVEAGNLYVDLQRPAVLKKKITLPPDGNNNVYRLVIDLSEAR